MRLVLATTGGAYGAWVAAGLRDRGITIAGIVVDAHVPTLRTALKNPRRAVGPFRRRLQARPLRAFAPLVTVANLNEAHGVRALRRLAPDVLVLAGARILSAEVLSIPTHGAINAHPARLPGFRGTGVVGWAILEGVPVTVTVHFVSPAVDAGDVIERRLVPIVEGDTLDAIEERADRMCSEALADVAARIANGERVSREPQEGASRLCRWLGAEDRMRCATLVADGAALRAFRDASR